ncbi:MAG: AMP-binding protein [Myxococcota bacterium]
MAPPPPLTLDGELARRAAARPDALAVVSRDRALTWAELEGAVDALAGHLLAGGLVPGDVVAAFPRRDWQLPVLFLATARAGGVFLALDGRGDPAWLARGLALAARIALPPDGLAARLGSDPRVLPSLAGRLEGRGPGPSRDPDAVCYLHASSGTSGAPRLAPTRHAHVAANARAALSAEPFGEDERFLCLFAPATHPHEHFARPLYAGATAVMLDGARPRGVLDALRRLEVTRLFAVPSAVELLCATDGPPPGHLRGCEVGGAAVAPGLAARASARLGCPVVAIWGCAETTGVALRGEPGGDGLGRPLPGYEVDVVGADPVTGVGELRVRGPGVVEGWLDGAATAARFRDGWFHTGDLVRRDGGELRFVGRREERLDVAGAPVYTLEIERVVGELPGVRQVVVVPGEPGEPPRAAVVGTPSRRAVLAHCRARLPASATPRVEFWDDLPLTPAGLVDKRAVGAVAPRPVGLAVNSMLIGARPIEEVFALAARVRDDTDVPLFVDLRSRRSPASDPAGTWAVAHTNADFDLADPREVDRAVALSRRYGVSVGMASAYVGACAPDDLAYGLAVIDEAYRLAEVAPGGRLVLRVLGGDLLARARGMRERWQDARRRLRDECVATILAWEAHTRARAARTGRRVYLGLELHHGQYLADLPDVHHCCRGLRDTGWDLVGFVDDPANRFIAGEGDVIGALDFARMTRAWGGRVLAYHVKDVRYLAAWSQFHPQPMQRVGEPVFVWGTHKYEWAPLGEGEVDVRQAVMAARLFSDPAHPFCPISTEHVAASATPAEAEAVVRAYVRLVEEA